MTDRYKGFLDELRMIAAALERHKRGRVLAFSIGEPATEALITAVQPTSDEGEPDTEDSSDAAILPDTLIGVARIADGARLQWEFKTEDGEQVEGEIEVPSLEWLQQNKTRSFNEGDLGWSLAPSASYAELVMPCEDEAGSVFALTLGDSLVMAEGLTMEEVWSTAIARLGIVGWDLVFDSYEAVEDDDPDATMKRCERLAVLVRTELGLPVPTILHHGP